MTSVSVPSTLVKCLYLFFDLPEIENPDVAEAGSDFTPRERRILLQKIFVQVSLWLLTSYISCNCCKHHYCSVGVYVYIYKMP